MNTDYDYGVDLHTLYEDDDRNFPTDDYPCEKCQGFGYVLDESGFARFCAQCEGDGVQRRRDNGYRFWRGS
ncbi:MAG: hypothetical protein SF123_07635 [Chloroflexota bacterium]|nr:hypothetical protein [Chloroflexota bacterium]